MESLLTGKKRFSEFSQSDDKKNNLSNLLPEGWEVKRLEELCSHFKSGLGITSKDISVDGNIPVYGGNGLRGYTTKSSHKGVYILIGRQGALCGNILLVSGAIFISEHAIAVQVKNNNHLLFWMYHLDFMNLNRLSESSAQPGLSVAKLSRLKTIVPPLLEQQKIASVLSSSDREIEKLEAQLEKLEEQKKGLMQKLLTGKVRVKVELFENEKS